MKIEDLIGRKFLGFKYEDTDTCGFSQGMSLYIGRDLSIINFDKSGDVEASNGYYYPLEEVKKHLIPENEVIKVLDIEHGKKVIEYWKGKGVDTENYRGSAAGYYYGVINGEFNNFNDAYVTNSKAKIITLPEEKCVWVRDTDSEKWDRRILVADLGEDFVYRYLTALRDRKDSYIFHGYRQISHTDPNEAIEQEIKELESQINKLKLELCK
jgi:hypothetical protein